MRDEKLARLTDVDLLIVGDLGLRPLKGDQPIDLYEFVRLRYEHGSTIITSNRDTDELHHHLFGDPLLASAAMHRLLHRAYRAQIVEFCDFLYGIAKVPKKWVFNSFGHLTCYLYRDLNDNGRMDGKEKIHGELIHATPENEADDWLGMQVDLGDSHGCIHVKPADIDDMINRKFLKKGALVVVHRYDEARIPYAKPKIGHAAPYEVHFYPGMRQICAIGIERL